MLQKVKARYKRSSAQDRYKLDMKPVNRDRVFFKARDGEFSEA